MNELQKRLGNLTQQQRRLLDLRLRRRSDAGPPTATSADAADLPLSHAQRRFWWLHQLDPGGYAYNTHAVVEISGSLRTSALRHAFEEIVRRHSLLRTTYANDGGVPRGILNPDPAFLWEVEDLRGAFAPDRQSLLQDRIAEMVRAPFDLQHGPLLRVGVWRVDTAMHVVAIAKHHIVSDRWSMGLLVREVAAFYDAFATNTPPPLPALRWQYADFARAQNSPAGQARAAADEAYWLAQLSGELATPRLRADRPGRRGGPFAGASVSMSVPGDVVDRIARLAQEQSATLFMPLLAGYVTLLHRHSGEADFVVSVPVSGRREEYTQSLIGCFINTLPLRCDARGNPTFRQLLGRIRQTCLDAFSHQDLPFDRIVEILHPHRDGTDSPLSRVMFTLNDVHDPLSGYVSLNSTLSKTGLSLRPIELEQSNVPSDLILHLDRHPDGLRARLAYDSTLFEPETAARMLREYCTLLTGASLQADLPLSRLPLLEDAERRRLLHLSRGPAAAYPDCSISDTFESVVSRTPDAIALVCGDGTRVTYAALNERSNDYAHALKARRIGPGQVVAIVADRSLDMIAATIGILKSGAAYLPLDPLQPSARRTRMLKLASAALLLSDRSVPDAPVPVLRLDGSDEWLDDSRGNLEAGPPVDAHAYICFTSGSTGTPKGVAVTHRGVMRLVFGRDCITLGPHERILHLAAFAFDASTFEIWGALLHGATLVLYAGRVPAASELGRIISTEGVTTMWLTASLFNAIVDEAPLALQGVRQLVVGGEALSTAHVRAARRALPGVRLINGYGPTEATTFSCLYELPADIPDWWESIPIGGSLSGSSAYVLDDELEPVPIGVPGELYIGGDGLATGYVGQPRATAERFVPDPHDAAGGRLYRTGDLVARRADGAIEFLGRRDQQVKIRGFRVELGEIEHALLQHDNIREAVVLHESNPHSAARLVAYVATRTQPALLPGNLSTFLAAALPDYMLPAAFVTLESLPRLSSGKIDRRALAALNVPVSGPAVADAPDGDVELALAELWCTLLHVERVGRFDSFFALGGHSILATQLAARIERRFEAAVPLRLLMEEPTIDAMARHVAACRALPDARDAVLPPIVSAPEERYEPFPLTDIQQAYWIGRTPDLPLGGVSSHGYQEVDVIDLDLPRFERAFRRLIGRHDMLRALIDRDGRQRILEAVPSFRVEETDLRGLSDGARDEALTVRRAQMSHEVAPAGEWPLFALRASRLDERRTRLHVSTDALIGDAASWRLLGRELAELYRTPGASLPPIDITFRDYVLALQALKTSRRYRESEEYWRARLTSLPAAPPLGRPTLASTARPRFSRRSATLPETEWRRLKARAAEIGVSPTALLLCAFGEVIAAWSGSDRFTINLTVFHRLPVHPHVGRLVGDFTTLILLAVERSRETFRDRTRRLQRELWESLDHRYFTGVQVLRELTRLGGGAAAAVPVVFTSLLSQEDDAPSTPLGDVVFGITQTPQVSLDHQVYEKEGRLAFNWDTVDDLFPAGSLDAMFAAYAALLQRLATEDEAWGQATGLIPDPDSDRRHVFNSTGAPVVSATLHGLFMDRARERPDHPAVVSATRTLSYRELDRASDALAARLRAAGAEPNTLVAVALDRGWQQAVAVLGVLKAGAAYLPVDPNLPGQRVRQVIDHARVRLAVTASPLTPSWPAGVMAVPCEEDRVPASVASHAAALPDVSPADLAYVMYTSGSTGQPKGVTIDHRGAVNTVLDINERFVVGPDDRVLALSSLSFDLSVYDIFGTLAAGGTIVVPPPGHPDPADWAALVRAHGVTVWNSVPALMELFVEYVNQAVARGTSAPPFLRLILLSGDWIPLPLVPRIRATWPGASLVSLGGATEASIWSIAFPVDTVDNEWTSVPYGYPLKNQTIHVLTPWLEACRVGVAGEIFIGGIGVARGYWQDPDRTRGSFITHPDTGDILYRTGDLGRHRPDMAVELLGRADFQVKVRGHRIELGEIEAALMRHPGVHAAVVSATGSETGGRRLVAYVVAAEAASVDPAALRRFVAGLLPAYMVPSTVVLLDRLPLTPNGKIDRSGLKAPAPAAAPPADTTSSQLAERVAALVEEVLTCGPVGPDAHLLELGANSVQLIRIVNSIESAYGMRLKLEDIYADPTVQGLVAGIERSAPGEEAALHKAARALAALKQLSPEELRKRLQSTGAIA